MVLRRAAAALSLAVLLAACQGADKHAAEDHPAPSHAGAHAVASLAHAALPTEDEIAALFDLWNETLATGSPHDMAMLYAEDGVLLPTVSNQARSNRPEITEYFEHFQALSPRGVINEQYIHVLDSTTAINSGVYTFDVVREGRPDFVVARYNFVYEKVAGQWRIKSHHSSAMPEPLEGRPQALAERRAARRQTAEQAHGAEHAAPSVRRVAARPAPKAAEAAEPHAAAADHAAH